MLFAVLASLVSAILVVLTVKKAIGHLRLRAVVNKIPPTQSDGLAFIGGSLQLSPDACEFFHQVWGWCRDNADEGIAKFWLGVRPMILVYKADTVQVLLNSSKHNTKGFIYDAVKPWLGEGLITSQGEKWFVRRKLITPTFHFKILEEFMHVFNDHATNLVRHLDKLANGPGFNILPHMFNYTLDIICDAAMGVKVDSLVGEGNSSYVSTVYRQAEIVLRRMKFPWLWPDTLFYLSPTGREHEKNLAIIHSFTRKVLEERKAERKSASTAASTHQTSRQHNYQTEILNGKRKRRLAFLDMLLEHSESQSDINDAGILEEMNTFMFAGHDTTGAAFVWNIYMLGWQPEEQQKLQQEIDSVLGDNLDREVTMKDINELKYLDCFVKETLRLYSPVSWYSRLTSEPCTIGGYEIPEGTEVLVFNHQLHRDPEFFPDPEKFDPDRWLTDDIASRHPFCYIPFSAGIRNCIGQRFALLEVKTTLCYILRKFNVRCSVKREDVVPFSMQILKPKNPAPVSFQRRVEF